MDTIRRRTHAVAVDNRRVPVDIELVYLTSDPYAVHMHLAISGRRTVTWIVGRALISDGLRAASGEGDVRLQPIANDEALLTLRSVDGESQLHVARSEITRFLGDTYAVVPENRESDWLDIDFDEALRSLQDTASRDYGDR